MVRRALPSLTPEQRRRCLIKGIGIGCGVLVLLVLGGVAGFFIMLGAKPPVSKEVREALVQASSGAGAAAQAPQTPSEGTIAAAPSPSPLAPAGSAPPSTESQVEAIKQAVKEGYRGPVRVTVMEADLNRHLSEVSNEPIQGATCAILEGRIVAQANINVGGRHLQGFVEAMPRLEGNRPRVVITQAYVGRIPIPQEKVQELQAKLDAELQRAVDEAGATQITGITTQRGQIIIDGNVSGP